MTRSGQASPATDVSPPGEVVALLGPTNTGKTFRAIERMLEHESGMIGLPLRLLAREVYDKLTLRAGESQVALVTGEEKRIPRAPRYWVCTVEAMPVGIEARPSERVEVDFLAVDEIQLSAHPERGHVFTDRLLNARGRLETWFLGAETMRSVIEELIPSAEIRTSPRLSRLSFAGSAPIGQIRKRSAIVAFSVPRVYELGERIKHRRGGAAIVLGALSPRARNAQVALFQSGEVDYLVATDAIGMGLNLDIEHVAFADVRKFDGREARDLEPAELGQIAGRAGRHTKDGTFGTLAPLPPFSDRLARDLEDHRFSKLTGLVWRSDDLDFTSLDALADSLDQTPRSRLLRRVERAEDQAVLAALRLDPDWRRRLVGEEAVSLAWEVCRIPDYRKLMIEDHVETLKTILDQLLGPTGKLDPSFLSAKLEALSRPGPDIDSLMAQIASVRTWNYVANQSTWVPRADFYRARAAAIENQLADSLHAALVARFVDKRKSPPIPTAKPSQSGGASPPAKNARPSNRGELPPQNPFAALAQLKSLGFAAEPEPKRILEDLVAAQHAELALEPNAVILFGGEPVAKLVSGRDLLTPDVSLSIELSPSERLRAHRRLVAFARDVVAELFAELTKVRAGLSPAGRGLLHVLEQRLGTLLAAEVRGEVAALETSDREALARAGLVLGDWAIYLPRLLKQPALGARKALVLARLGPQSRVHLPSGSTVSIIPSRGVDPAVYSAVGHPVVGARAVRADVLERVAQRIAAAPPEQRALLPIAGWLGCKSFEVPAVLHAATRGLPAMAEPEQQAGA